MRRATYRLVADCNNACVFCSQRGSVAKAPDPAALRPQLRQLRESAEELTFTGGEPLLHPLLEQAIGVAREVGFGAVGLQSNGRLADGPTLARLADAGLTDLHLSIHGSEAAVHDYHSGVPGSFVQLLAGLGAARARGLTAVATTVLTRSNYRVLSGLPRLLRASGVTGWLISLPRSAGAAREQFDRVIPRLGIALPFALHALHQAEELGLASWVDGAPLCLLGPYASRVLPEAEPRAFGESCRSCPVRRSCAGVDPLYLARFRGDELSPRANLEAASARVSPVTRLFVGPGECVTGADAESANARSGAVALPLVSPSLG